MLAIICWVHCSIFASFFYDFRQLFLLRITCEIFSHYLQLLPSAVRPFTSHLQICSTIAGYLEVVRGFEPMRKLCRNIWINNTCKIVLFKYDHNNIIMIQHIQWNLETFVEELREWQNMFSIIRFCCGGSVPNKILLILLEQRMSFVVQRTSLNRHRGSLYRSGFIIVFMEVIVAGKGAALRSNRCCDFKF